MSVESTAVRKDSLSPTVKDWAQKLKLAEREKQYGLPQGLLSAVMQVESTGAPSALSPKGAQGLFQIMPATAKGYGVDPLHPEQAADGAARLLRDNLKRFNGDVGLAVAAYNCNPAHIEKYKTQYDKWPKETQNYVPAVLRHAGLPVPAEYKAAASGTPAAGGAPAQGETPEGEGLGGIFGFIKKATLGGVTGMVAGGGLGMMIGKFIGGFFNDGSFLGNLMGMFLTAALTIGGALMGGNKIGGWINDKLGSGDKSPEGNGHAQGKDVTQPSVARAPEVAAAPAKVGGFTAEELNAVLSAPDMKPNAARLQWVGNEVKLKGVVSDDTDTKGVIDVAKLKSDCNGASKFTVVRVDGGSEVGVSCAAPKATPALTNGQSRG